MNKIEQLIEKRENTLMNYTINSMWEMVIKEFLKDLQSLQEPTEEKEVEIDRNDSIINMKYKTTC